jgi:DNA recombination protein RmuC
MTLALPLEIWWALGGFLAGLGIGLLVALLVQRHSARLRHALEERIKHQGDITAERDQLLKLASEQLTTRLGTLAHEHFRSHSETFLKLARESLGVQQERAKGELAAREQAIETLVRPIQEALRQTEARLEQLDRIGRETHGNIKAQLEAMAVGQSALTQETRSLVNALRRPEVRGRWGELTLRRLVELAGMVEHCDFETQSHRLTEQGAIRPDLLVHLPDDRLLVVDVKTPLDAYLEAIEADREETRAVALKRHAGIVAGRIRELASKSYWAQFPNSPEFVILFIPGDQFLSAALAERPNLLDDALRQNIILATPTSFVALLKAVAYGWQQVALAENAAEIRTLAAQLYERLAVFSRHLAGIGKALGDSVKAFNRSVGSLERMVLPSARRFTELGIQPREELPPLQAVEEQPRDVSEPGELSQPTEDSRESQEPDEGRQRWSG